MILNMEVFCSGIRMSSYSCPLNTSIAHQLLRHRSIDNAKGLKARISQGGIKRNFLHKGVPAPRYTAIKCGGLVIALSEEKQKADTGKRKVKLPETQCVLVTNNR